MRYSFFVTIHARPRDVAPGPNVELDGRSWPSLAIDPRQLATTTFDRSFEATCQALEQLERMFCEPDGSFVWVSPAEGSTWQVDGNLYDHNQRLLFVDAKGSCPREEFDQLLSAFGWTDTPVVFQLTRAAVFLDEATFRQYAERVGE